MELRQLIKDYMISQKLMQLSTISKGDYPWTCSVWYGFDEEFNIYFFSAINRQHSIDIEANSNVSGAMALPHTPKDSPRGLQYRGLAQKLVNKDDISNARANYQGRIFDSETIDKFINNKDRPHAFYKITPDKFVLFDTINFPDKPRQEYILTKLEEGKYG